MRQIGLDGFRDTMDSVLSIDDGSTDGTNEALANYARYGTRVRILHQDIQGLTRALIKGIMD